MVVRKRTVGRIRPVSPCTPFKPDFDKAGKVAHSGFRLWWKRGGHPSQARGQTLQEEGGRLGSQKEKPGNAGEGGKRETGGLIS